MIDVSVRSLECNKDDKCPTDRHCLRMQCSVSQHIMIGQLSGNEGTQTQVGFPRYPTACQGGAYEHWNAIPRFQLNSRKIIPSNCLSLVLRSHLIKVIWKAELSICI